MAWHYGPLLPATAGAGLSDVIADLSITDSADAVTAVATVEVVATFSKTDSADTFSSTATGEISAVFSKTDTADTFSFTGTMGEITAVFSKTDTADTIIFDATDGSSSGALVFRPGVGRNAGGMFVIEPGTGTNEITPGLASAVVIRYGRFSGGLIVLTPESETPPPPPDTTVNAGPVHSGIGFGGGNTISYRRNGSFSMLAAVNSLVTIDVTDRIAEQGEFGIGFGGGNSGAGIYTYTTSGAIGFGGSNAVSVSTNSTYAAPPTNGAIGFGGSNGDLFVISNTFVDGDFGIGGGNSFSALGTEYANIQEALAQLQIEDGETLRELLRLLRAANLGTGIHGDTVEYKSKDGSKTRIRMSRDSGNRNIVDTDAS